MNCLRPFKRKVEKYGKEIFIPCNKCLPCRINKTREWTQRLMNESQYSSSSYFLTLTYRDEDLPIDENGNCYVCKKDIQDFFKRLRKKYPNSPIRYFCGSEYGEQFGRSHYHLIVFNLPADILQPSVDYVPGMPLTKTHKGFESYINRSLNDVWQKGYVTIGEVNRQRISYCAQYFVTKQRVPEGYVENFNLMSRRPGIGIQYVEEFKEYARFKNLHSVRTDRGSFIKLPRYYDKKIYTDEERVERWTSNVDEINKRVLSDPIFKKSVVYSSYFDNYDIVPSDDMEVREKIAESNYKLTHSKDIH